MPDFKLPDLGEGVAEAEIDRWLVKEGDEIEEDDPLVEVITDKATAEIPSPYAGIVTRIHFEAGEVVPVGAVLVSVDAAGDGGGASPRRAPAPPPPGPSGKEPRPIPPMPAPPIEMELKDGGAAKEVKAMPPVRKLARTLGVDMASVTGTGPRGRVTREDVERAASSTPGTETPAPPAPAPAPRASGAEGGRREPLRGVRRTIAERMSAAHHIVPPVTHVEECDVTELEATRELANERAPRLPRLTFMPFIVKAVVAGLKDYPALNASLDDDAGEIVYHDRYDIGIAVDTPAGLTVVVVRAADRMKLREMAAEIERLATAAREGKLKPEDVRDATFTITSPGRFGGLMATPLVFHPQSAILGVHRAGERPVVRDGQMVARLMMNLSITFDHRIMDGMQAARFVLDLIGLLEHPAALALES